MDEPTSLQARETIKSKGEGEWFPHAVDFAGDLQRAFTLWDAVSSCSPFVYIGVLVLSGVLTSKPPRYTLLCLLRQKVWCQARTRRFGTKSTFGLLTGDKRAGRQKYSLGWLVQRSVRGTSRTGSKRGENHSSLDKKTTVSKKRGMGCADVYSIANTRKRRNARKVGL